MGRSKKFMLNSVTTALLQVVTMIAGFITPRFMLTAYGSEINGLISSILQFISYFNLVEAGLSSAAVYSLYKPIAEKDYNRINRIVVAAKHFYVKSGLLNICTAILMIIVIYVTAPMLIKFTPTSLITWFFYAICVGTYSLVFICIFHIIFARDNFRTILIRLRNMKGK